MRFLLSILLSALLAFVLGLYLDWWSVAIATFVVGFLIGHPPAKSWLSGFTAIFLLWGILAWYLNNNNNSILSARVAPLFGLGDNSLLLVLITAVIAGIIGGFGALTASFLPVLGKKK